MRTADFDFEEYIAKIRAERDAKIAAVGDISNGAVLRRHGTPEGWAAIIPCASKPGKWRIQYFDLRGFSGHSEGYSGPQAALEAAVTTGYRVREDEALDRFSGLHSFQRGNFITDLLGKVKPGGMTLRQADAILAEYDAAHAYPLNAG